MIIRIGEIMILVFENISGLKSYSLLPPPPIIKINPMTIIKRLAKKM